jgi:hypothetical protein
MHFKSYRSIEIPADDSDAVGIVVHGARFAEKVPTTLAFIWGGEVNPAPSLPFGRWKAGFRAA